MTDLPITPNDLTLLKILRGTIHSLDAQLQGDQHNEVIECIHMILDELIKRQDSAYLMTLYSELTSLAKEAVLLLADQDADGLKSQISDLETFTAIKPSTAWSTSEYGRQLAKGVKCLTNAVNALTAASEAGLKPFLHKACLWETRLNAWTESGAQQQEAAADKISGLKVETLTGYLQQRFLERPDIGVTKLQLVPGGYSKTTILFDTHDRHNGDQSLVIRAEKSPTPFHMDGSDVTNEYSVLKLAYESGIPVAEPLWLEADASRLGARFLVSRKAEGKIYGSVMAGKLQLSRNDIRTLVAGLAKIHNTQLEPDSQHIASCHLGKWIKFGTLKEFTPAYIAYWQGIAEKNDLGASPVLARGFNWLYNNIPDSNDKPCLVHGDYGLHNILLNDGKISAVLDWEACHIGDPADEFTNFSMAMSQHLSQAELIAMYLEEGGKYFSEYRLRYFDVLNYMKCLIVGYGGLVLLAKHPHADVKNAYTGYRFMPTMMSLVSDAIERADAAKGK